MMVQGFTEHCGRVSGAGHVNRRGNMVLASHGAVDRPGDIFACDGTRFDDFEGTFLGQQATTQGLFAFQPAGIGNADRPSARGQNFHHRIVATLRD